MSNLGASRVFPGGIVVYADTAKQALLNVPETILKSHGSISKETALAMAYGARAAFNADLAVAETGIASTLPSWRNRSERPPGLYFVAIVADGYEQIDHCIFSGNREHTKFQAAELALRLVLNYLEDTDRN
jgi:PncC family amidohydrolase